MTLRIILKSGEWFDIPNADWKTILDGIMETIRKGNDMHASVNFCVSMYDYHLLLNLNEVAAIYPSENVS